MHASSHGQLVNQQHCAFLADSRHALAQPGILGMRVFYLQGCAFCGPADDAAAAGACIRRERQCPAGLGPAHVYSAGCPSRFTPLIIACLLLYLAAFSPGLGPVPWAVNAEIFPLQARP